MYSNNQATYCRDENQQLNPKSGNFELGIHWYNLRSGSNFTSLSKAINS